MSLFTEIVNREETEEFSEMLVSLLVPQIATEVQNSITVVKVIHMLSGVRDIWFWNKFRRFLEGGDLSEDDRDTLFEKLSTEGTKEANAQRLIQIIDQVESQKKVDYIINATHSLCYSHINRSQYYRICNIIVTTLEEDLLYLQKNIAAHEELCFCDEVQGLINRGLMEQSNIDMGDFEHPEIDNRRFIFTNLAQQVDMYALSYNSCNRYSQLYFGTQEQ